MCLSGLSRAEVGIRPVSTPCSEPSKKRRSDLPKAIAQIACGFWITSTPRPLGDASTGPERLTSAGFGLKCLQIGENHQRMPLGVHRRIVLRDAARGVDDEGHAAGDFHESERAA